VNSWVPSEAEFDTDALKDIRMGVKFQLLQADTTYG
jgi:hypothetical protein